MENITSNLRNVRTEKNISQLELSAKTGISVRCIKYYEALTRIPSLLNAYKLSETLETPITELFPYSDKTT
ncbi:Helix-turn-helix [Lachnospiraceae bacterium]|nr:Helix-turn-helix [Lachnospiraceae bacterium]